MFGPQFDALARAVGLDPKAARWVLIVLTLALCAFVVGLRAAAS